MKNGIDSMKDSVPVEDSVKNRVVKERPKDSIKDCYTYVKAELVGCKFKFRYIKVDLKLVASAVLV